MTSCFCKNSLYQHFRYAHLQFFPKKHDLDNREQLMFGRVKRKYIGRGMLRLELPGRGRRMDVVKEDMKLVAKLELDGGKSFTWLKM